MTAPHPGRPRVEYTDEAALDLDYAVLLLTALEGAVGWPGHQLVLPLLELARAELVDLGQRTPDRTEVELVDVLAGLRDLEARLTTLLGASDDLQQTMRLSDARRYVRRAIAATR